MDKLSDAPGAARWRRWAPIALTLAAGVAYALASWLHLRSGALLICGFLFTLGIAWYILLLTRHSLRVERLLNAQMSELRMEAEERRRSLEELHASEARLRLITEQVPCILWSMDTDLTVSLAVGAGLRAPGLKAGELTGRSFADAFELRDPDHPALAAARRVLEGEFATFDLTWRERPYRCYVEPLRLQPGGLVGAVGVCVDISEQKIVDAMKDEFIATVSHELRTPLTSIMGSLALIADGSAGAVSDQAKQMIEIAHRNCERLVRMVQSMLSLERIRSGKMEFKMQPVSLVPLVEQAIDANRPYGEKLGVRFALSAPDREAKVLGDADRLTDVITNLLSNAAKFSPPSGQVGVSVSRHGSQLRVSVTDQGPGIPGEFRSRMFKKFSQVHTSNHVRHSGTGLGLSIAEAIVKMHQGRIDFTSEPNVATTFYFELPEWDGRAR